MEENVLQIQSNIVNQYLIKGAGGFLLVDTGLRNNYAHLNKFLSSNRLSFHEVEMLVITHADGDHFGCLSQIMQNQPEIISCASAIEAKSIERGESSRELRAKGVMKLVFSMTSRIFSSPPAKICRILVIGEEFPFLGGLEILDTRGHTPGHISLWSSSTRTLFSGDSIRIEKNTLSPSRGVNTWDEGLSIKSFELQMDLRPDRIYGGHGVWERK